MATTPAPPRARRPLPSPTALARLAWPAVPAIATLALAADDGAQDSLWYPWAFVLTAAAGSVFAFDLLRPRRGPATWAVCAFAALAAWTALSVTWALLPGSAFVEGARTMLYASAFALTVAAIRTGRDAALLTGLVSATCGLLGLIAAVRLALDPPADWYVYDRFAWPTGYPNTAAALLVLAFWGLTGVASAREVPAWARGVAQGTAFTSLGIAVLAESRGATYALILTAPVVFAVLRERLRLVPSAAISLAGLALATPALRDALGTAASDQTQRAARLVLALAVVTGAAGAAWAILDRRRSLTPEERRRLGRVAAIATAVAVVIGGVVFLAANGPDRARTGWHTFTGVDQGTGSGNRLLSLGSNRYDFWRVALDDLGDHPLHGVGAASYGPTYLRDGESGETPAQSHGQGFELLSTLGLPGFLLGLGIALAGLAGLARRGRRAGHAGDPVLAGGFAAALAMLVHAQVDWHWQTPVVSIPLVCMLGAGAALLGGEQPLAARWTHALGGVFLVGAIVWVLPGLLAVRQDERSVRDGDAGAARSAARLNPWTSHPYVRLSALDLERGDAARALEDADKATGREPRDWTTWMALARAGRAADRPAVVARACARAREENPRVEQCP